MFYIKMEKTNIEQSVFSVTISNYIQFVSYKQLQLLKAQEPNMYKAGFSAIFGMCFWGKKKNIRNLLLQPDLKELTGFCPELLLVLFFFFFF